MAEELNVVGKRLPRVDGFERVTGNAMYASDIMLPGMLIGKILRSPYPHARIVRIDTSKALALLGVRAAITYKDIPPIALTPYGRPADHFVLEDRVRFVGDEVAAVAAIDSITAEEAITLIDVQYEVLPHVIDPEKALEPGAPKVQEKGNLWGGKPFVVSRGDLEKGFSEADTIVEDAFKTKYVYDGCPEPRTSVATWDGDKLTVWESTQSPFHNQQDLAKGLKIPMSKVRVIASYMGGGFGSKTVAHKHTFMAAILSRKTGKPVKIEYTREEECIATVGRWPTIQRYKAGVKKDGTLTAMHLKTIDDTGAYNKIGIPFGSAGHPAVELYKCPNARWEGYTVYTNKPASGFMKSIGYAMGHFGLESFMDLIAEKIAMDPIEFRLKNYTEHGDQAKMIPYSSNGLKECMAKGAAKIGWDRRNKVAGGAPGVKKRGIGMANCIWTGISGGAPSSNAIIKVNDDGSVYLLSGQTDIGTGNKTCMVQVAAEAIGARFEDVGVTIADTDSTPYDEGAYGSRTAPSMAPAVKEAAENAKKQLLEIAAPMLNAKPDELDAKAGRIFLKADPSKGVTFKEVATKAKRTIVGSGYRRPNPPTHMVAAFGAQFAEVEVDVESGHVKVLRMTAAHDCGRAINPMIVENQIDGGVIQAIGMALSEEHTVDPATGVTVNSNWLDFKIPTHLDTPEIDPIIVEPIDPIVAYGIKGIGEPPTIPTHAAIANAIYNAIGVRVKELPITPDKILKGLKLV